MVVGILIIAGAIFLVSLSRSPSNSRFLPVNLTSAFNHKAIVIDGTSFGGGGFDNGIWAYSWNSLDAQNAMNLHGPMLTVGGIPYRFGAPNGNDAISSTTVTLPSGKFGALNILAAAVNGDQTNQRFTVHYSDGSTQSFVQSLSDWYTPGTFPGETIAATTAYRDGAGGGSGQGPFYMYTYSFALNSNKTVSSLTLPDNPDVVILAMTLR